MRAGGPAEWSADGFRVGRILESGSVPLEFGIAAAYPNPFNASFRLEFSLEAAGEIEIALFDLTGRQALEIERGNYLAGRHSTVVQGASLPSGIYIARLAQAGRSSTKKVLLLK